MIKLYTLLVGLSCALLTSGATASTSSTPEIYDSDDEYAESNLRSPAFIDQNLDSAQVEHLDINAVQRQITMERRALDFYERHVEVMRGELKIEMRKVLEVSDKYGEAIRLRMMLGLMMGGGLRTMSSAEQDHIQQIDAQSKHLCGQFQDQVRQLSLKKDKLEMWLGLIRQKKDALSAIQQQLDVLLIAAAQPQYEFSDEDEEDDMSALNYFCDSLKYGGGEKPGDKSSLLDRLMYITYLFAKQGEAGLVNRYGKDGFARLGELGQLLGAVAMRIPTQATDLSTIMLSMEAALTPIAMQYAEFLKLEIVGTLNDSGIKVANTVIKKLEKLDK